jgi:hypothetical protein
MQAIAVIHLAWLSLLPIGIAIVIYGTRYRLKAAMLTGVFLVLVSVPAVMLCEDFWPLDFLIPATEMRVPVTAGMYEVNVIQEPGGDFYNSFFEIRRQDGKIAYAGIDGDDNKWWRPRVIAKGTRLYFVRGGEGITANTSFVDFTTGTLFSGYYKRTYKIKELDFQDPQPQAEMKGG